MKKMRVLIFAIFLCLVNGGIAFSENPDLSGRWFINLDDDYTPVHSVCVQIFPDGSQETIYDFYQYVWLPGNISPWMDVTQGSDGSISGTGTDYGINGSPIISLTGTVSGSTLTCQMTWGYTEFYAYTYIVNLSGTVSSSYPFTIGGTYTCSYSCVGTHEPGQDGSYYNETHTASPSSTFNGHTNTLKITIISGPEGTTSNPDVTFTWVVSGGEDGVYYGYWYQLDSQPSGQTTNTSVTFKNLPCGSHTFTVSAADGPESAYATRNFTIQTPVRPEPSPDFNFGNPNDPGNTVGDPINSVTGNMHISTTDLTIPGPGMNFSFIRTYNSLAKESGPLGFGWTHSYNLYLTQDPVTNLVKIKDEQAKAYLFKDNQDGTLTSQRGEYSTLTKNDAGFIWIRKGGKKYSFDLTGKLTQITDRNNNTISLSYNDQSQLISITDTVARQINLYYNSQGMISTLTDPVGRSFTYNYDSRSNLVTVTDPLSHATNYEYDPNHNITRKIDALSKLTYFTYDNSNRCTSSTGENNLGLTNLTFDPANNKTTITDSKGNATTHYYNSDSLITKIVNPQGNEITSVWDANLNLLSRTDELDRTTSMGYDPNGNLIMVTDPDGCITSFTYDPIFSLLVVCTDSQENTMTYMRDSQGNPVQVIDANYNSSYYGYNSAGQITSSQDALGNITNFTYDPQGNLIQIKDALDNVTNFTYDGVGNLVQSKDAQSNVTNFIYDNLNRPTQITYPDNTSVSYGYDSAGNRISATDTNGNATYYTYDQLYRMTSNTNALGYVVTYTYDTEGNLIYVTDQNNDTTSYKYDNLNRLTSKADALNNKTQYQYDAAGNRISSTDANGQTAAFEYDDLNRLTKITYPNSQISYAYDSLGRRVSMTDSAGTTAYTYDKLGRLTQVAGPLANDTVSYTYDKAGNRLTMTDPNGSTSYGYDALNRLLSITDAQGKVTNYAYDSVGNLTGLTYANGINTSYIYDNMKRLLTLTQQTTASPNTTLAEFNYTYDKLGRRTQVNLLDGSNISYSYDAIGELLQENKVSANGAYKINYSYDPAENRIHMVNQGVDHSYTYNGVNQLTEEDQPDTGVNTTKITVTGTVSDPSGVKQVTVNGTKAVLGANSFTCAGIVLNKGANTITVIATDNLGNNTTKIVHVTFVTSNEIIYVYDNNGNLIKKQSAGKTVNLSYNERNLLAHFSAAGVDETYQYDGDGRRVSVNSNSNTKNYIYDSLNVISERDSSGATTANYLRNPNASGGIGGIISQQADTANPQYYLYDGLGSVVNLTSVTGAITQSYSYDAFGNVISQSGSVTNSNKFLTKQMDASGLVYFGARYYGPVAGRFITQDPMGMVDGPNLYTYCCNDPVNCKDLWGLCLSADSDALILIDDVENAVMILVGGIAKPTGTGIGFVPSEREPFYLGLKVANRNIIHIGEGEYGFHIGIWFKQVSQGVWKTWKHLYPFQWRVF